MVVKGLRVEVMWWWWLWNWGWFAMIVVALYTIDTVVDSTVMTGDGVEGVEGRSNSDGAWVRGGVLNVHTFSAAVDHIENSVWNSCILCQFRDEHRCPRIPLWWFQKECVATNQTHGEHLKKKKIYSNSYICMMVQLHIPTFISFANSIGFQIDQHKFSILLHQQGFPSCPLAYTASV